MSLEGRPLFPKMDDNISIIRSSVFSQKKDAACSLFVFLFGFLAQCPCHESFFWGIGRSKFIHLIVNENLKFIDNTVGCRSYPSQCLIFETLFPVPESIAVALAPPESLSPSTVFSWKGSCFSITRRLRCGVHCRFRRDNLRCSAAKTATIVMCHEEFDQKTIN